MVSIRKYSFIQILIIMTVGLGEEFYFSLSSDQPIRFNPHHWQHPASNSTMIINTVGIDVFQWMVAAETREAVRVELVNPIWEYIGSISDDMTLPENIKISKESNFRGTPTIYIKVTPWRIVGNIVEVLAGGEIRVGVEPPNFPITYNHPHLLNGKKHTLQRTTTDQNQYLIICPSEFESAAQSLANIHADSVAFNFRLNTVFVTVEEIIESYNSLDINYAIRQCVRDSIESNDKLEFVLFFGDETKVPPIFYENLTSNYPSDDFYSTNMDSIFTGLPQLSTGRIPVSTLGDANTVVNKIHDYILNPTPGVWRSKIALVADDMNEECFTQVGNQISESLHTTHSQELYDTLKTLLPVLPYYGVHYPIENCEYPTLTRNLIQTINNGVALINYIGHGSPNSWSHELFINKSRDLSLIHASENVDGHLRNKKLAIWVAGTCSFGNYYGENSFMEELLIKEDGAIAVIATTDEILPGINWNYIKHLFGLYSSDGIEDFMKSDKNTRLGELIWNAKTANDYMFHTFGDPALPLPFPKIAESLVNEYPDSIDWVEEEIISFTGSPQNTSFLIRNNEKEHISEYGNLTYTVPETYLQMDFTGDSTCFKVPADAGTCDGCVVIQAYREDETTPWNGKIETILNISLLSSSGNYDDRQGPTISLSQGSRNVTYGSAIFPNIDLTISLEDESGINLMDTHNGGIRYQFDDNNEVVVPATEFVYTNCSGGFVKVPVPLSLSEGTHQLSLKALDGLNTRTDTLIHFDLLQTIDENKLHLSKVYPIPSPFSESTYFTMFISEIPSLITITVYSLNGNKVRIIKDDADNNFFSTHWDGRDDYGNKIANGAYFYHVRAETKTGHIFEDIYKLAKIE